MSVIIQRNAFYLPCVLRFVLRFICQFVCLHRPLHVAARNGLTVVVQELLGKGASVLAVDENGKHEFNFVST